MAAVIAVVVAALTAVALVLVKWPAGPEMSSLRIATTTSVENSGLLDALVPVFERKYGVDVEYVAVGTGQAIRVAEDGNADLIFVHDKDRELAFVRGGYGGERFEVMKNLFWVVGPAGLEDELKGRPATEVMRAIAQRRLSFVSRGDESGTHSRERALWRQCGVDEFVSWYLETGSGMSATLRVASEKQAFTLTDMATYLVHRPELRLIPYVKTDPALENVYSVIPVSSERLTPTKAALAGKFVRFLLEEEGRRVIADFGKEAFGQPLFELIDRPGSAS